MNESSDDSSTYDLFVTNFPKKGFGIVEYLQGRVHFALLDQMKLMSNTGMSKIQIREILLKQISEIIDNFEPEIDSKNH